MKFRLVLGSLAGCVLLAAGALLAAEKETAATCPISGKAINKEASIDYKGGKLCFCCNGCVATFNKNPEKYAAKANLQLVATGQAEQVACPRTGKPVNDEKTAEVGGVKVAFCCGGCQGKVAKASAEDQVALVFGKGFDKGFKVKAAESK
jgi:YHS domain-containing protein